MSDQIQAIDALHLNGSSPSTSPAAIDSPPTPVNELANDPVKIVDQQQQPATTPPILALKPDVASTVPEMASPVDPDSIPIDPPHGTPPPPTGQLLPDVAMAEAHPSPKPQPLINGHSHLDNEEDDDDDDDVSMSHVSDQVAASATTTTSTLVDSAPNGTIRRSADRTIEEDGSEPPAKRARKYSNADQASLNHSIASLPPASPEPMAESPSTVVAARSPAPAVTSPPSAAATAPAVAAAAAAAAVPSPSPAAPEGSSIPLTVAQWKFCSSTIRTLKKLKDATPFLRPVDPVALNIPHYPTIIKHPMDFSTIERKLASSNPAKPDTENPHYETADQFIADVRRVFSNCLAFNGPEHIVTHMGTRVEGVFDKQIKHLPAADEPPKAEAKKVATPTPPPVPKKTGPTQRRPSTSVPAIRRSDESNGRPKREIHAPPPKDLPFAEMGKRTRPKRPGRDDGTAEQLRFCGKIINDLFKKHLWTIASPFYEPVDWVKLDIPSYPKIIKKPMDLGTMRRKLETDEYTSAQKFYEDFKLIIRNCFTFNPAGTPVNLAGIELQRIFDEKWKALPQPRAASVSDVQDEDEVDESEDERARTIEKLESQMEEIRRNLMAVKSGADKAKPKPKKAAPKPAPPPPPVASTSKPKPAKQASVSSASVAKSGPGASASASHTSSSKKGKAKLGDDDVLSFDQKKDLSDAIAGLDGQKLERVIQIIHEGVPEIRDSTEEIELEIDSLPASVLTKLYNFVLKPMRSANQTKRSRAGKGGGTGGLKRKSMDEDVEAEKIRQLEERMRLFEEGLGNGPPPPTLAAHSDESDDSSDESSGSESE